MILGIDLSTVVCGWCVIDEKGVVQDAGHIALAPYKDLYRKLDFLSHTLSPLMYAHSQINEIWIEEPAKMYSSASTAHVMSLLQRWNGMVCAYLYRETGIAVNMIGSAQARARVGIKIKRQKKATTKNVIAEFVKANVPSFPDVWQYKKTGTLKDYCYDICDAYVVAEAGRRYEPS